MKRLKNFLLTTSILGFLAFMSMTQQSCSKGYGCPTEEYSKRDINDQLNKSKRGKSNLFPKRMRKKMDK